jgi:thiol-disulfide isomerase/thioredoxin
LARLAIASFAATLFLGGAGFVVLASNHQARGAGVEQSPTLPAARGGRVALFAVDSPTAVLVVTAECAKCRIGAAMYADVSKLAAREGFSFRSVVASKPAAARQFSLLLPNPEQVAMDAESSVLRALRVRSVPTLVLVDSSHSRTRVLALQVPRADTTLLLQAIRRFRQ